MLNEVKNLFADILNISFWRPSGAGMTKKKNTQMYSLFNNIFTALKI